MPRRVCRFQLTSHNSVDIFFDTRVPTAETVFCGIGRPDRTLEILLSDLAMLTNGQVLPLAIDVSGG